MLHTGTYLSNLFLLSERNESAYHKTNAATLWKAAENTEQALHDLESGEANVAYIYSILDKCNPDMGPYNIDLRNTYFNNNNRLNKDELAKVLHANARTLRFESRKKTVYRFVVPVFNLLVAPLRFPVVLAYDLFVNMPIDFVFGAVKRGYDFFDSNYQPKAEAEAEAEQPSEASPELSSDVQSSYFSCCTNPITTCFNKAKQCFGYGIAEETNSADRTIRNDRRMQVA